jgi:branched-subunit amino acid ABC-type transport system permease component
MEQLFASLADGLLLGFVYGLSAMGLTLIFGVMDVINLAHGPIIALGMFGVFLLSSGSAGIALNPYLALIVVAIIGLFFGVFVYFIAVHRVLDAPHLSSLLSTFAVNMMIIGIGTAVFTTSPRNLEFSMGALQIGSATLLGTRMIAAVIAVLVAGALYIFLYRTQTGKAIRAVANNRAAAELMGIPSTQVLALTFGIGTMLAMISGGLISTFFSFNILSGGTYELKSFVIVVMGGLGNPTGALIGGLILGALEGIVPTFMPVSWVPVIEFVLFVLILMYRPKGLLGGRQ